MEKSMTRDLPEFTVKPAVQKSASPVKGQFTFFHL